MKLHKHILILLGVLIAFAFTGGAALAQDKDELQKRAAERYPKLLEAKRGGLIGETSEGFVEAVEGKDVDRDLSRLVDEENTDRRALYKLIARETSTDEALVIRRAAARNFEKACSGDWLKRAGKWEQKK